MKLTHLLLISLHKIHDKAALLVIQEVDDFIVADHAVLVLVHRGEPLCDLLGRHFYSRLPVFIIDVINQLFKFFLVKFAVLVVIVAVKDLVGEVNSSLLLRIYLCSSILLSLNLIKFTRFIDDSLFRH